MVVTDSCATGSMWAQELMRERGCALCHIMVPQEGEISLPLNKPRMAIWTVVLAIVASVMIYCLRASNRRGSPPHTLINISQQTRACCDNDTG